MMFFRDLWQALQGWGTWMLLGFDDIGRRYRRSIFGPLWLTGGIAAACIGVGFLFSQLMDLPMDDYLHFLAAGLAIWTFISLTIVECGDAFSSAAGILRNYNMPKSSFVLRVVYRNFIAFLHYLVFFIVLSVVLGKGVALSALWAIPGAFLICILLFQIGLIVAFLSSRYRDFSQIIQNTLQALFFITPIMWKSDDLSHGFKIVEWNPLHHLVSVVRDPLIGLPLPINSMFIVIGMIALLFFVLVPVFSWGSSKVIHWI